MAGTILHDHARGRAVSVELAYQEAGAGLPVVLLHAFPLSSRMWAAQLQGLADACRVITPDLRGFGGSPLGDDDPSVDAMADDVAALLDRLHLDRVVVGGLSMGGYVVMALLRRHTDRISAVVLANTKAGADPEPARANRERIAREVLGARGLQVVTDDVVPGLLGESTKRGRPDVVARVHELHLTAEPAALAWAQLAMAGRPDSFGTLRAAQIPALVIAGEEDQMSPLAEAYAMADALPQAKLVTIQAAGHLSAMEVPEEFNAAVRDFVASLSSTPPVPE
jgi:pimeloyl-ACP methyl ester carboxylesterase